MTKGCSCWLDKVYSACMHILSQNLPYTPLVLLLLTGGHFRWDVSIVCISIEVLQQIFSSSEDPGRLLFGSMGKCMVLVWCDWSISSMDARDAEEQRTLALGWSLFWCSLLRVWNECSLDVVDPCMTTCLNHPKFCPFIDFNSWWENFQLS